MVQESAMKKGEKEKTEIYGNQFSATAAGFLYDSTAHYISH
jgi:hypothetical protein